MSMHSQPGGRPLSQHVFEGPQKSWHTPGPTSQVMHLGHSALFRQGGGHVSTSMHTQPTGCPLSQHLFEGPQKSVQTPSAALQVVQIGQSVSDWHGVGHVSATRQTGPGWLPLEQQSSPEAQIDSQVLVS
jgi:hypothetical protein